MIARKVYLAAPIFTPQQLAVVEDIRSDIYQAGMSCFSPYHASRDIWKGRAPKDCTDSERLQVLEQNISHLEWCDLLLCWTGGWQQTGLPDTGVVWEMGFANAVALFRQRGAFDAYEPPRPTTMVYIDESDVKQSLNLMLAGTIHAAVRGRTALQDALQHFENVGHAALVAAYPAVALTEHEKDAIL